MSFVARLEPETETEQVRTLTSRNLVAGKTFLIGRTSDCDIFISDPKISRKHAEMRYDEGKHTLILEKHTGNVVLVNGAPIEKDKPVVVHIDDKIQFGGHNFFIRSPLVMSTTNHAETVVESEHNSAAKNSHVSKQKSGINNTTNNNTNLNTKDNTKSKNNDTNTMQASTKQRNNTKDKGKNKSKIDNNNNNNAATGNTGNTTVNDNINEESMAYASKSIGQPSPQVFLHMDAGSNENMDEKSKTVVVPSIVFKDQDGKVENGTSAVVQNVANENVSISKAAEKKEPAKQQKLKGSTKVKEIPSKKRPVSQLESSNKNKIVEKQTNDGDDDDNDDAQMSNLMTTKEIVETMMEGSDDDADGDYSEDDEEADVDEQKKKPRSRSVRRRIRKLTKSQRKRLVSSKLASAKNSELKDILVVAAKNSEDIAAQGIQMNDISTKENSMSSIILDGAEAPHNAQVVDATYNLAYRLGCYAANSDRTHDAAVFRERLEESQRTTIVLKQLYERLSGYMVTMENALTDLKTEMTVLQHDYESAYRHISAPIFLPKNIVEHFNLDKRELHLEQADIECEIREQKINSPVAGI